MKRSVGELVTGAAVLLVAAGFLVYALASTGQARTGGMTLLARFGNVGSVGPGSDVRVSGVKVGRVLGTDIDAKTFQAVVRFTVQDGLEVPSDSSAVISSGGLLGGAFLSLSPGGSDTNLKDGGEVTVTQSAVNLEDLLGKFIFNVGSLADATQKSLDRQGAPPGQQEQPGK